MRGFLAAILLVAAALSLWTGWGYMALGYGLHPALAGILALLLAFASGCLLTYDAMAEP